MDFYMVTSKVHGSKRNDVSQIIRNFEPSWLKVSVLLKQIEHLDFCPNPNHPDQSALGHGLGLLHQQAQHQIHELSPKEREALIESRLGSMSSITSIRTIEQKIPRVDIPDDMEGAFGFDPDGGLGYDKPFLRDEVSDQLER